MKFKKVSWGLFLYLISFYIFLMLFLCVFIANGIVYIYVYYKTGTFAWCFEDIFDAAKIGLSIGGFLGISVWIAAKLGEKKATETNLNTELNNSVLYSCPCCKNNVFHKKGKNEICSICGWIDDPLQSLDPDYPNGKNKLSLNQAKIKYNR